MENLNDIAVIFDMDGVLVDNAEYHKKAFKEYFKDKGGKEFRPDMFGMSNKEIFKEIFPDITDDEIEKYTEEKEALYRKLYKPYMKPVPGLINFLKALKEAGIKIAVGSSAPKVNIDFVLDGLNIRQYFDKVTNSDEVENAKPAPDIYLKAAEKLNIQPADCVVFEDAVAGIKAARNAGMKVVGVATSLPMEKIELEDTDKNISDFISVDVNFIKTILDK